MKEAKIELWEGQVLTKDDIDAIMEYTDLLMAQIRKLEAQLSKAKNGVK